MIERRETTDEVELHVENGDVTYVHVIKTPVVDSEGQVQGIQAAFWDVTERMEAQEGIKRYADELEEKNEDL